MAIFVRLTVLFGFCLSHFATAADRVALVYAGPGACADGCYQAAAKAAKQAGYKTKLVKPADINRDLFKGVAMWIQPGGDAYEIRKSLSEKKREILKSFIRDGGMYLGFCAGGYFADQWIDNAGTISGLDIISSPAYEYSNGDQKARIEVINWEKKKRFMYFQDGPAFKDDDKAMTVLARYQNNDVAAFVSRYGRGVVAISGVHPEAQEDWLRDDHLTDPDGLDNDLSLRLFRKTESLLSPQ